MAWSSYIMEPPVVATGMQLQRGVTILYPRNLGAITTRWKSWIKAIRVISASGKFFRRDPKPPRANKPYRVCRFTSGDVKLSRLPGWDPHSWGYHGDDGHSFAAEEPGAGTPYGPIYGTGDIIGCGIDFLRNKAFFTKNGVFLEFVFDGIGRHIEVYPSVGLRHEGESIRANFGHEPFKFDIGQHLKQQAS